MATKPKTRLDTVQAAEYAGVCPETIRRWVRAKLLKPSERYGVGRGLGHRFVKQDVRQAAVKALA